MSRAAPPHWVQATNVVQKVSQMAYQSALPQKSSPRLGRKGFLYLQKTAPTEVKAAERVRIIARRMLKAERDERMDITQSLTVVKQYMAGFTRPRDLRTSNWFPGGAYISREKSYESPPEDAYKSHTVFLLESRYNILYGVGRVDAPEYIYGVCREQDLPGVLRDFNSSRADRSVLEAMDNARWPEGPQINPQRRQKWWIDRQDLTDTLSEMGLADRKHEKDEKFEIEEDGDGGEVKKSTKKSKRVTALNPIASSPKASLIPDAIISTSSPSTSRRSVRVLHSSSVLLSADERVPQLHHSPSLMDPASDAVEVSTRPQDSKIPSEVIDADGVRVHPSGFVVPTATQQTRKQRHRDPTRQTGSVAERVAEEKDLEGVTAETSPQGGKVPYEVRGSDGTVTHPSGFEPTTPADGFEHGGNFTVDSRIGQQPLVLPGKRGFHTTASPHAEEVEVAVEEVQWDFARAREQLAATSSKKFVSRQEYLPKLAAEPFWRPLITVTLPTRPLAHSLVRLAKGLPTGRPYHADINNDDKKCRISMTHRMRGLRLNRIQDLAIETAQKLAGMRGGFIGLRFETDSLGRGVGGEGLANPVPSERRLIDVGVGNWYRLADETRELFRLRAAAEVLAPKPFNVWGLDDFGRRLNEGGEVVPWRQPTESIVQRTLREEWYKEYSLLVKALGEYAAYSRSLSASLDPKPKQSPVVLDRPSHEEDLEEDFEDENVGDSPADRPKNPRVFMRPGENVNAQVQARVTDPEINLHDPNSLPPLDFVVCSGKGQPLLGPVVDETGAISMEGFTHEVPIGLGRQLVGQRHDMYCLSRTNQIAQAMAARGRNVSYPKGKFSSTKPSTET
ncbi:hypothetical protein C8F04DRAFT_559522 [Mycena alexandri]|uniref:Uncharacterized protein n=1 Tax=Mycena alexandri TaxID=1745969 RepID=A0AAD6SX60_9AGAR|nr:hypothetical protein C8F04DRAFT_559522 [Mycena alexandri]